MKDYLSVGQIMTNEYEEKLIANFNNFILRDDLEEILKSTKKKAKPQ